MIDLNKPLQTRDGRKVRIYATDGGGDYPLHGAILTESNSILSKPEWIPARWTPDGRATSAINCHNLVNVEPVTVTAYVNVYNNGSLDIFRTAADANGVPVDVIACAVPVTFTYTPGQGL